MKYLYREDAKKRLLDLLESRNRIIYVSLNDKEIADINKRKFPEEWLLGIPAVNENRKEYYSLKSRVKNETTFQKLINLEFLNKLSLERMIYICTTRQIELKISTQKVRIIREKEPQKVLQLLRELLNNKEDVIVAIDVETQTHQTIRELAVEYPQTSFLDVYYAFGEKRKNLHASDVQFPPDTNFSITVVLTLYKRPEVLERQYKAVRQQTLYPAEIILFQDQIKDGKRVKMNDTVKSLFDQVKIASENVGVWGRFEYARDCANSPYVCLFDDDTIPGERWLENCHFHMQNKLAIYSTLGISLIKSKGYPYNGFYRIGWSSANKRCEEVDFAGHAWFIKKEWISWMFENTTKYQGIRYAAEDMCLSVKAKEHNIPTIILPHPRKDKSLWGSQYECALKYGNSSVALGINGNYENMYNALNMLIGDGWKPMYVSKRLYVNMRYIWQKIQMGVFKICRTDF